MDYLKKKELGLSLDYDNNILNNNSHKYNLRAENNIQNKYLYTEIDSNTNKNIINNGILMYKSIFKRKDGKLKNRIINEKDKIKNSKNFNNIYNYKANGNNYSSIIKKTYVILKSKKQQFIINKNNSKEDNTFLNFHKQRTVNNVKYFIDNTKNINTKKGFNKSSNYQEFTLNKKRNVNYNVNTFEQAHTENCSKIDLTDI